MHRAKAFFLVNAGQHQEFEGEFIVNLYELLEGINVITRLLPSLPSPDEGGCWKKRRAPGSRLGAS